MVHSKSSGPRRSGASADREKGAGKGTFVRCLQRIFGAHAFQVTSREEVIGKFNGHLQDCVLFVADEAYWGGDKRCVGRLQGMITETTLPIERKGIDLIQVPNYLHVLMLAQRSATDSTAAV
jgi:hypothetical protein